MHLYSREQAAERLGISGSSVNNLISKGLMRCVRMGVGKSGENVRITEEMIQESIYWKAQNM